MWNYEARSVIKKRGNLIRLVAYGDCSYPCYQKLEELRAAFALMDVIPYSGVRMTICPIDRTNQFATLNSAYEAILTRLPLKNFSLILDEDAWNRKQISALLSLKKLFRHFSGVVEQLMLDIEEKRMTFIRKFVQNCSFPALKVLKLRDRCGTSDGAYTRYMKALVSQTRNLQELHVSGTIDLMVNVLEGSKAVLVYQEGFMLHLTTLMQKLSMRSY